MKMALLLVSATLCLAALPTSASENPVALEQRMRQRLAKKSGDLEARFQLARALSWQGRFDEALVEFASLIKVRPKNADFLLGMAQVHLWRGAPEMALPLLLKARRLAPKYEDVWRTQIQALLAIGGSAEIRQARLIRDQAKDLFPRSDWQFALLDTPERIAPEGNPPSIPTQIGTTGSALETMTPAPPETSTTVPARDDRYEWETGFSYEGLTNGQPNWRSAYLLGQWHGPDKKSLYGGIRETERYALTDHEAHVGGIIPLGTRTQVQVEFGASNTHQVLAKNYFGMQLQAQPAPGWSLDAGLNRSYFDLGPTRVFHFNIDRYIGNERFGYTLYEGGPDGAGLSPSHRWQWAHYYGESDWVGISLNYGRETEYTGDSTGFLTSQVRGASLSGRHDIAPGWALVWNAGSHQQGDSYTRSGVLLGLRHAF